MKKKIFISIILIGFIISSISVFAINTYNPPKSRIEIIEEINKLDENLEHSLKHSKNLNTKHNDILFLKFFDKLLLNLDNFRGFYDGEAEDNVFVEVGKTKKTVTIDGVTIHILYNDNYFYDITPYSPCIKLINNGETGADLTVNYSYLNEHYSRYLSNSFKEFLKYMNIEELLFDDSPYNCDGEISISKKERADLAILWRKFLDKYPTFYKKDMVEQKIDTYVFDIIQDKYKTFDINKDSLTKEGKEGYEYFLNYANKSSQEYKKVKNCYEILQENNYIRNNIFLKECVGIDISE